MPRWGNLLSLPSSQSLGFPEGIVITNAATQEVIDNANGYGYKTRQNAEKAGWYKFKGGKSKKDTEPQEAAPLQWQRSVTR